MSDSLQQEMIPFGLNVASISGSYSQVTGRRMVWLYVQGGGVTWMPGLGDDGIDGVINALEKLLEQAKTAKSWVESGNEKI